MPMHWSPCGRVISAPPSPRPPAPSPPGEPLTPAAEPYSPHEIDYPEIAAAHRASSLASGDEAAAWRAKALRLPHISAPESEGAALPLPSPVKLDWSRPALA